MILVGSNTLGDKTDKCNTQSSKTKESGGGEIDRCDGAPGVLSVGRLEHLAPPPLSLLALIEPLTQWKPENFRLIDCQRKPTIVMPSPNGLSLCHRLIYPMTIG